MWFTRWCHLSVHPDDVIAFFNSVGPSFFPAFWKFESDITHGATFLYILCLFTNSYWSAQVTWLQTSSTFQLAWSVDHMTRSSDSPPLEGHYKKTTDGACWQLTFWQLRLHLTKLNKALKYLWCLVTTVSIFPKKINIEWIVQFQL
jgi:hypothetical protein